MLKTFDFRIIAQRAKQVPVRQENHRFNGQHSFRHQSKHFLLCSHQFRITEKRITFTGNYPLMSGGIETTSPLRDLIPAAATKRQTHGHQSITNTLALIDWLRLYYTVCRTRKPINYVHTARKLFICTSVVNAHASVRTYHSTWTIFNPAVWN